MDDKEIDKFANVDSTSRDYSTEIIGGNDGGSEKYSILHEFNRYSDSLLKRLTGDQLFHNSLDDIICIEDLQDSAEQKFNPLKIADQKDYFANRKRALESNQAVLSNEAIESLNVSFLNPQKFIINDSDHSLQSKFQKLEKSSPECIGLLTF